MDLQSLAVVQPMTTAPSTAMDTASEAGAEAEADITETTEPNQSQTSFRQYVRKQNLPPHRTLSPGFVGEDAVLDEVAIITESNSSDVNMTSGNDNDVSDAIGEPAGSGIQIDSGNHSSEEELEEIITNKKPYVEILRDCKRKWTDLSQSDTSCESDTEFEEPELRPLEASAGNDRSTSTSAGSSSCDTPSGDEDHNHNHPTPVQFSTSPPVDVHKPRRSLSPPPKLFGFRGQEAESGQAIPEIRPRSSSGLGTYSSSLGDLSRLEYEALERRGKKTISPRKRSRTSRVQHIQRPCLDFEKMQQLRARAVSWRHGGELSLFCW
eukprot:TRINITY_DN28193_c0_g1_i1.p1 TRINITY_DN28193_c0_g1~~TRINITY_DN28193_c0_g1_i1.p1  ORF type:complete len:323 (+),score=66.76 TRINITY_DN28193_c0_g1_i1:36-1004(+)